jgi:uncharacterized protein
MTDAVPRNQATAYVAPLAAFVALMALERVLSIPPTVAYPVRLAVVCATLLLASRSAIPLRPSAPWASVAVGAAVFAIWVGPDALFGAAYRHHWLFENAITGKAASSLPPGLKTPAWFLAVRAFGCTALVPILEELFWRGWLMRWITRHDWWMAPIGEYAPKAFWIVALLFASEHGPYWEVGLAAGVVYNSWLIRTRNLADCVLAHAVTNGILSVYVLLTGQLQYWM